MSKLCECGCGLEVPAPKHAGGRPAKFYNKRHGERYRWRNYPEQQKIHYLEVMNDNKKVKRTVTLAEYRCPVCDGPMPSRAFKTCPNCKPPRHRRSTVLVKCKYRECREYFYPLVNGKYTQEYHHRKCAALEGQAVARDARGEKPLPFTAGAGVAVLKVNDKRVNVMIDRIDFLSQQPGYAPHRCTEYMKLYFPESVK